MDSESELKDGLSSNFELKVKEELVTLGGAVSKPARATEAEGVLFRLSLVFWSMKLVSRLSSKLLMRGRVELSATAVLGDCRDNGCEPERLGRAPDEGARADVDAEIPERGAAAVVDSEVDNAEGLLSKDPVSLFLSSGLLFVDVCSRLKDETMVGLSV